MRPRLQCSFSGGRTSAYMSIMLQKHFRETFDICYTFANTGAEHPDTLRFVHEIDQRYDLGVVWLEAMVNEGAGNGTTHRVVSYETASRNGEPYEAMCRKYGLPNQTFKACTRELKQRPMGSYMRSIGWVDHVVAIGIRTDETRRVSPTATEQRIIYPLVHWFPTDKQDVLSFFEGEPWDLQIAEHQGNCITCFKKSARKLALLYQENPRNFDFAIKLDQLYKNVGPNNVPGPRQMFRGRKSAPQLVEEFRQMQRLPANSVDEGGCSESCEVYETEEAVL
jgi:hypothetical protein